MGNTYRVTSEPGIDTPNREPDGPRFDHFGPGDLVELTERQAEAFDDRIEPAGSDAGGDSGAHAEELERQLEAEAERADEAESQVAALRQRIRQLDPLSEVDFASGTAEAEAREAGLEADDFEGVEASGDTGFTADDVRGLIDDLEGGDGEGEGGEG